MRDIIPYVTPTEILTFFNQHPLKQFAKANAKVGEVVTITSASLWDYFATIPEQHRSRGPYVGEYHNALLKMMQLLVNEGLLTPEGNSAGFDQRYRGNGISRPNLMDYGYYDFMIFGFPVIRKNFEDTVRPIIINQGVIDKSEDIGTGFTVRKDHKLYFVTARHCLPKGELIYIPQFLPQGPLCPVHIYAPSNENIDIAVLEVPNHLLMSDKYFYLDEPQVLDQVLTMGYPPIQGLTEAIQVSETSLVSTHLKSSSGQVTGQGLHYWGGMQDHFLISARVKGGNSGGPVINRFGLVVGVIIELLQDQYIPDLLGYGVAISSKVLEELLTSIESQEPKMAFNELNFEMGEHGFRLT